MTKRIIFWGLFVLLIGLGIFARAYHPEADASNTIDFSQGTNTDGFWYLNKALSNVGAANWDPRLDASYNLPLVTAYATAYLKIFGSDLAQLNLLNLFPGVLTVFLLGIAALQAVGRKMSLLVTWLVGINFILITFSRLPLIYIWMPALGFLAVVLMQLSISDLNKRLRLRLLTLGMLLISAYLYKNLVLFHIPCLLIAWELREKINRKILAMIVGAVVIFGLGLLVLSPDAFTRVFSSIYFSLRYRSSIATHGDLATQNWRFWRMTTTFLYLRMPLESFLCFFALLALAWGHFGKKMRFTFLDYYAGSMVMLGHLMVLPFAYAPLRYFVHLIPSMVYLAARSLGLFKSVFLSHEQPEKKRLTWILAMLWMLPLGNLLMHIPIRDTFDPSRATFIFSGTLIVGFVLGSIAWLVLRHLYFPPFSRVGRLIVPIAFVSFMTVTQLLAYDNWANEPVYSWREAKEDMEEIVPEGAVIVGPYGNFFAYHSKFKGYPIDMYVDEPRRFLKAVLDNHSTHLAIDSYYNLENYKRFLEANPDIVLLERLYVRGFEVLIFRLPPSLPDVKALPQTLFEQGVLGSKGKRPEMAVELFKRSVDIYPKSGAGARALMDYYAEIEKQPPSAEQWKSEAMARNPDHPAPYLLDLQKVKNNPQSEEASRLARKITKLTSFVP